MSDLERILWTAAATIFGGAFVFVFGQLTSRFLIEPWYEQRRVVGAVAESLLNYAHLFADSGEAPPAGAQEAALHLRQLSSELLARTVAIPGYQLLAVLGLARGWGEITAASRGLVGLSNRMNRSDWIKKMSLASQVAVSLGIESIDPMFEKEAVEGLPEDPRHA